MTRDSELDPDDWDAFRTQARAALDSMIDHLSTLRESPVGSPRRQKSVRVSRGICLKKAFPARRRSKSSIGFKSKNSKTVAFD